MFSFENYKPIFDETEFNDSDRFIPKKPYPTPTKLEKSTTTIITSLNQNINIDYLRKYLKVDNCQMSRIDFYNQLTIVFKIKVKKKNNRKDEDRNINTKIFQNGTVHMTGGQSINEAKRAVKELINGIKDLKIKVLLPETEDKKKYPEYIYCVDNPDIHFSEFDYRYKMINRHFHTNFEFCPGTLYKILQEKGWKVNYNPNRFSAVVLKTTLRKKTVNFLMFKSGKVTISLANCTDEFIVEAYNYINEIFKEHYDKIVRVRYKL